MFEKNTKQDTEVVPEDAAVAEQEAYAVDITGQVVSDDTILSPEIVVVSGEEDAPTETDTKEIDMGDKAVPVAPEVTDYGLYSGADVVVDGDTVVITIPLKYGVTTVKAPKAVVAAWATDNVAGKLLSNAKNFTP